MVLEVWVLVASYPSFGGPNFHSEMELSHSLSPAPISETQDFAHMYQAWTFAGIVEQSCLSHARSRRTATCHASPAAEDREIHVSAPPWGMLAQDWCWVSGSKLPELVQVANARDEFDFVYTKLSCVRKRSSLEMMNTGPVCDSELAPSSSEHCRF